MKLAALPPRSPPALRNDPRTDVRLWLRPTSTSRALGWSSRRTSGATMLTTKSAIVQQKVSNYGNHHSITMKFSMDVVFPRPPRVGFCEKSSRLFSYSFAASSPISVVTLMLIAGGDGSGTCSGIVSKQRGVLLHRDSIDVLEGRSIALAPRGDWHAR